VGSQVIFFRSRLKTTSTGMHDFPSSKRETSIRLHHPTALPITLQNVF